MASAFIRLRATAAVGLSLAAIGSTVVTASASSTTLRYQNGVIGWSDDGIWKVANPDGSGQHTVTPAGALAGAVITDIAYSPDGTQVALAVIAGSEDQLWTADADGTNARLVTHGLASTYDDVHWSSDGAKLYFTASTNGPNSHQILVANADGSGTAPLPGQDPKMWNTNPTVSASGEVMYMSQPPNTAESNVEVLDPGSAVARPLPVPAATTGAISPDGSRVAEFTDVPAPGGLWITQISVVGADGTDPVVLYHSAPAVTTQPEIVWSPDSTQIAWWQVEPSQPSATQPPATEIESIAAVAGATPSEVLAGPPNTLLSLSWAGGAPISAPPSPGGPRVYRDAGANRVLTGIAISQQRWPTPGSARAVVLATSRNFPDALSGGPLAAKKGGPLLLTDGTAMQLDPHVLAEIRRALPQGGPIYVLGGDAAISPLIVEQLKTLGYAVTQFKGADREDTALRVAIEGMGSPRHVVVATGNGYADALAAGPYAAGPFADGPDAPAAIVLSNGSELDSATRGFLIGKTIATVGAQAGHAWPTAAKSFSGADRFATAAMVAAQFTDRFAGTQVGIANGTASATNPGYPDALTGGTFMAESNGPIILVDGVDGVIPSESRAALAGRTADTRADIFGGAAAVPPALAASIVAVLHGTAEF